MMWVSRVKKDAAVKECIGTGWRRGLYGTLFELSGEESTAELVSGYLGTGRQKIDMNYVARHRGKKDEAQYADIGHLKERGRRKFAARNDRFVHGCVGAGETRRRMCFLSVTIWSTRPSR